MADSTPADDYITIAEVARKYHITKGNLAQLRYEKKGPPHYKPTPRTVLYRDSEVAAWIAASVRKGVKEQAA